MAMKEYTRISVVLAFVAIVTLQLATGGPETETATTTVTINNVAPVVGTVTPTSPVVLSEHTTVTVTCSATVNDSNGWEDVSTANGTFYLDSLGGGCTPNNANCYTNASCALSGGSDTTVTATCEYTVQWYAQASTDEGNWNCAITATDTAANDDTNSTTTTVSDLLALDITTPIAFGTMSVGQTSSSDSTDTVTNTGNVRFDINVNGTNMTCDGAESNPIGVTYIRYHHDSGQDYSNMTSLTTNPADTAAGLKTNFDLVEGAASDKLTYWKISIPTGVSGSCTGYSQFEAVKG